MAPRWSSHGGTGATEVSLGLTTSRRSGLDMLGWRVCPSVEQKTAWRRRINHPVTPDGRYFVVRGRLWRCANPGLSEAKRAALTHELMAARRAKGRAMRQGDTSALEAARMKVDFAKRALGERGPVWWADGAPDYNRHLARNTPYADWFAALPINGEEKGAGSGRS